MRAIVISGTALALISVAGVASALTLRGSAGHDSSHQTGVRLMPMTAGHPLEPVRVFVAVENGPEALLHAGRGELSLVNPISGQTYVVRSRPVAVLKVSFATARPAISTWIVQFHAPSSFDHPLRPQAFVAAVNGEGFPLLSLNDASDHSNFAVIAPTEPYAVLVASEMTTSTRLATPTGPDRFVVSTIAPAYITRD